MARNKTIIVSIVFGAFVLAAPVLAMRVHVPAELVTPGTERTLVLPEAALNAHVISLGTSVDPQTGNKVEGIAFIHYKKGFHHRPGHSGGKGDGSGDTSNTCYAFLANGARWKTAENYIVDTTNNEGLSTSTVKSLVAQGLEIWDSETSAKIFGNQVAGVVDGVETTSPDGKNEVMFGDIPNSGAIGVTTVWGIFRGKPSNRELVEWDMMLDDADFDWSAEAIGVAGKMDLLNILTHEDGHALGLGHPSDSCTDETMYRFASEGEINKRDLNSGDIAGVNKLYK